MFKKNDIQQGGFPVSVGSDFSLNNKNAEYHR
jgi:hypothetical protein